MQEVTRDNLKILACSARRMLERHSSLPVPAAIAGEIGDAQRLLAHAFNGMELRRLAADMARKKVGK